MYVCVRVCNSVCICVCVCGVCVCVCSCMCVDEHMCMHGACAHVHKCMYVCVCSINEIAFSKFVVQENKLHV